MKSDEDGHRSLKFYDKNLAQTDSKISRAELYIDKRIDGYLILMRIYPDVVGYSMIKTGIRMEIKKIDLNSPFQDMTCEDITEDCFIDLDDPLVVKTIGNAIDNSVMEYGLVFLEQALGMEFREKPTPAQLVTVLAERIVGDRRRMFMKNREESQFVI